MKKIYSPGLMAALLCLLSFVLRSQTITITASGTTLTLGCNPSSADIEAALGTATASGGCSTPTVSIFFGAGSGAGCLTSHTRAFIATDACGNTATTSRTVVWTSDLTPPTFSGGDSIVTLGCNPTQSSISSALGNATASDACSPPTITQSDGNVQANGCSKSLTRVFTATDGCGNTATMSRTVIWTSDVTPPIFTGAYSSLKLGCNPFSPRIGRLLGTATASDACSSVTITQSDGAVQSDGCQSSLTRFFTATDGCGNIATISRTVVWRPDLTPPTFTGDYSTISIGCNPTALSITSALGSATAIDACTSLTITQTDGAPLSSECTRTMTRVFTATDGCGNLATISRTVVWTSDLTPPSFGGSNSTVTLGCNPSQSLIDSVLGNVIATDACSTPTITQTDSEVQTNECSRSLTRVFTATDACGNTATTSKTVVWTSEVTPPVFTGDYSSIKLGCNPFLFRIGRLLGTATATDACSSVTITQSDGAVQSDGCRNSLTRFFTATDGCGNIATISRTAVWTSDFTPPAFTGDYSTLVLGCKPAQSSIDLALGTATAIDACTSVTITATDGPVLSSGCIRWVTRLFTATDACGNRSTASRTATWIDEITPPALLAFGAPANGVLGCNPSASTVDAALGKATATDACSTPTITIADGSVQINGCLRLQTRTFTATDACGNTSTTSRIATWISDVTPPAFTGDYSTIELGCIPFLFRISRLLGTATATDACSSVAITQSDGAVQSNGCRNSLTRFFTATDACGNIATISRTVTWTRDTVACCPVIIFTKNKSLSNVEAIDEIKLVVKNPQYKNERLTFYGVPPGTFDVILINSHGQLVADLKKYHNDWSLSKLVPGLYFYNVLYKKENGDLKRMVGKLVISN